MEQKLQVTKKCNNEIDHIANRFCLSFVHKGITKCISNATVIEMYNTAYQRIRDYYELMKEGVKEEELRIIGSPISMCIK